MANSGSYARGEQPRSVTDPDAAAYDAAMRKQRAYNARQEALLAQRTTDAGGNARPAVAIAPRQPDPEHSLPDAVTASLVRALGSARNARKEWEAGHMGKAAADAALGLPDLYFDGALIKGALKRGGAKIIGPHKWRTPHWAEPGARKWLGEAGFLNAREPGHHWLIPLNEWGKAVPDFVKNQPWNIKGGLDAVTHGRIHGRYTVEGVRLPQFEALRRAWYGTPAYFKALVAKGVANPLQEGGPTQGSPTITPPPLM